MYLEDFVNGLSDSAFRALMDACIVRLQKHTPDITMLEVERQLAKHSRIHAIKSVRNRLHLGLKEAKDLVGREVPREPQVVDDDDLLLADITANDRLIGGE